jgi:hypothetical protein
MADIFTYNFPKARRGDTYNDVQFTVKMNGSAVNLVGAVIVMTVCNRALVVCNTFSTANNKLVIIDGINGVFSTALGIVSMPVGEYSYTIRITFVDTTVKTWIEGLFIVK